MDEFEKQLGGRLTAAVPEPPLATGRAAGARAHALRARRHRRAGVAGAAAVLLAVGVPVVLSQVDGSPEKREPTPAASAEVSCPKPAERGETPAPVTGPDEIAEGAVAVRLCAPYGGDWSLGTLPPADALTTGAEQVAASLNGLAVQPPPDACTSDAGPTWDLVFGYPDGSTRIARGSFAGCGGWEVGNVTRGDRSDMDRPLTLFQELLWQQRLAEPRPTYEGGAPSCDFRENTTMTRQAPLEAEAMTLCWSVDSQTEQPRQRAVLSPAETAAILTALNSEARPDGQPSEEECRDPEQPRLELAGVNAWGDVFRLDAWCGVFELRTDGEDVLFWRPSGVSEAILALLVEARPVDYADPDGSTPPEDVVTLWADLRNADRPKRASALWAGEGEPTPDGRIEIKIEGVKVIETPPEISAPTVLREVTALYWVVAEDGSWDDVREVTFLLSRFDPEQPWTIVQLTDQGEVPVGR